MNFPLLHNYTPLDNRGKRPRLLTGWKTKIPKFFLAGALFLALPVSAAITHQRTPNEASIASPVSINIAANYPDDLIYDGQPGSVGLTREPLLNMHWWGIAVYTETDNFVSECVSTATPLPTAVLNLGIGDYKTAISLAETKEGCEAFSVAEYPLFVVLEAANFSIK